MLSSGLRVARVSFRDDGFELKLPGQEFSVRRDRQFDFLEEESSDPALYWAAVQRNKNKKRKEKNKNKRLRGSYSHKGECIEMQFLLDYK